jgi:hypothetical protein
VDKDSLPDAEFKLVHQVHDKHQEQAKAKLRQFLRKRVLKWKMSIARDY